MRRNRKLLAILLVFLLVGATITFQLGLKVQRDADQAKKDAVRAHDNVLASKTFTSATKIEELNQYFKEWYIADYRFENPNTDKVDENIINGFNWAELNEIVVSAGERNIFGIEEQASQLLSWDEENNLLNGWANTAIKTINGGIYDTKEKYQNLVNAISDFASYEVLFNNIAPEYGIISSDCAFEDDGSFDVTIAKECLTNKMIDEFWTNGKIDSKNIRLVQQKVSVNSSITSADQIYYNVDMAKALKRLNDEGSDYLKDFVKFYREGISKLLTTDNTKGTARYMVVADASFASNVMTQSLIQSGDIKFNRNK